MKLKHTPGPWGLTGTKQHIICEEKELNTKGIKGLIAETWTDNKYDARLIATAPEMLDCLIQILKNPSEYPFNFCSYAERCVEKATGMSIDEVLE